MKLITYHVGNGVYITAVDKGISVDTSMESFTPLGGSLMGTPAGDLDQRLFLMMEHTEDFNKPEDISRHPQS